MPGVILHDQCLLPDFLPSMKIRRPKMLHLANSDDLLLLNVNNVDID